MAYHKSLFLLFVVACVNAAFGQNATAADKGFEIKYFARTSWFNAHLSCLQCGGQLASIESAAEQNYVEGLIRGLGLEKFDFWIAGSDLANEGIFNWYTTGEPVRYKNFGPGQPDNKNMNEHCLVLWGSLETMKLKWNDSYCDNLFFFICEKKPKCER